MTRLTRRAVLSTGIAGVVGAVASGCTPARAPEPFPAPEESTMPLDAAPGALIAYFSRAGENYHYGGRLDLEVGQTEVLAGMIAERLGCDTYRIEAEDPYPAAYDPTVERNQHEQNTDARPAIAGELPDVSRYDTILVGSPVWNVRAPMIMQTFIESADFIGKRILPFVTYAVSGTAGIDDDYRDALPKSTVADGLAVQGEIVADGSEALERWLRLNELIS